MLPQKFSAATTWITFDAPPPALPAADPDDTLPQPANPTTAATAAVTAR